MACFSRLVTNGGTTKRWRRCLASRSQLHEQMQTRTQIRNTSPTKQTTHTHSLSTRSRTWRNELQSAVDAGPWYAPRRPPPCAWSPLGHTPAAIKGRAALRTPNSARAPGSAWRAEQREGPRGSCLRFARSCCARLGMEPRPSPPGRRM